MSQKTLNVPTDANNQSNQIIESGSYGTVEVNETHTYKSPIDSSVQSKEENDGIRS